MLSQLFSFQFLLKIHKPTKLELLLLLKLVQMMIPQYYQVTNWTEHFNGISLIKSLLRCAVFAVLQEQTHSLKEIR